MVEDYVGRSWAGSKRFTCRQGIGSADFGSSAVPGVLRGLVEMIAEIFRSLLCPLPRHAYLPLFYAFFVVGNVPELPELRAGLGVQNGLQRFFDGLPGPVRPGLCLAPQDLVGHLFDASIFAHGALLFLAETLPQGEYNPARFLGAKRTVARRPSTKGADAVRKSSAVVWSCERGQECRLPRGLWVGLEKTREAGELVRAGTFRVAFERGSQSGILSRRGIGSDWYQRLLEEPGHENVLGRRVWGEHTKKPS